jgi:hypothetical protein
MITHKYTFTKEDVENMKNIFKAKTNKEALELWAYHEFDIKHNADYIINKISKFSIEIIEQ